MPQTMRDIMNPGATTPDADFPDAPADWSRDTARAVADADDLTLTDEHWEVIGILQKYFSHTESPNVRALHDALDERFHQRGGLKHLYGIFPGGPVAQGCRLAGLQAPAGAVDKSFGSVQ
jgi:tRNA 2-thiouridine synthesizing protein E